MIIKLSDYIMEQAVSDAEVSDIALEKYAAEMEVNSALARAYAKQIMMAEYAADYCDETGDSFIFEADTKTGGESKVKKFFRTIWEGIKAAIRWLLTPITKFINWLKSKFSKTKKWEESLKNTITHGSEQDKIATLKAAIAYMKKLGIDPADFDKAYDVEGIKTVLEKSSDFLKQIDEAFKSLEEELSDIGVSTDLRTDRFNRISNLCENVNKWAISINQFMYKRGVGYKTTGGKPIFDDGEIDISGSVSSFETTKATDKLKKMLEFCIYMSESGREKLSTMREKLISAENKIASIKTKMEDALKELDVAAINAYNADAKNKTKKNRIGELTSVINTMNTNFLRSTQIIHARITVVQNTCTAVERTVLGENGAMKKTMGRGDQAWETGELGGSPFRNALIGDLRNAIAQELAGKDYSSLSREQKDEVTAAYQRVIARAKQMADKYRKKEGSEYITMDDFIKDHVIPRISDYMKRS